MNHVSSIIDAALDDVLESAMLTDISLSEELTPLQMASETLGRDLLQACLQEMRDMPEVWAKMSEKRQTAVIERLASRVSTTVKAAVRILAADNRPTIDGILESVAVKDGIKATFKVSQHNPERHHLIDSVNKVCLLVVASAADHLDGMDEVKADPDQNPLDLNGGDRDMQDPGAWGDDAPLDAEYTTADDTLSLPAAETFAGHTLADLEAAVVTRKKTIDLGYLQSRFALSYDEARRVILLMLEAGTIALETEGAHPDENLYRVLKKPAELNLE